MPGEFILAIVILEISGTIVELVLVFCCNPGRQTLTRPLKEVIMLRILLADHHTQALWGLKTLLQEEEDFALVGDASDEVSMLDLSEKHHPDLILMDRELPGRPIDEQITALHRLEPKPVVIVMSSDPDYGRLLLKAGADAFVSKGEQADWLLRVLHQYKKRGKKKEAEENSYIT